MFDPISFLVPVAIVALAAIPLVLKLVPPNKMFGLRTRRTLADRNLWFRANRVAGCALLIAAAVSTGIYLAFPELASGRSFVGLLAFAAPLLVALVATLAYLRRS